MDDKVRRQRCARSSVGQSRSLLSSWPGVRISPGAPKDLRGIHNAMYPFSFPYGVVPVLILKASHLHADEFFQGSSTGTSTALEILFTNLFLLNKNVEMYSCAAQENVISCFPFSMYVSIFSFFVGWLLGEEGIDAPLYSFFSFIPSSCTRL